MMLKRTPVLAVFIAVFIGFIVKIFFELPSRPFSHSQLIALFIISYCMALGIALHFDPKAKVTTRNLLKINFYEEK